MQASDCHALVTAQSDVQFYWSFTAVTDSLSDAQEDNIRSEGQASDAVCHEVLDTNTNCIYYWNQQDNITGY